MKKLAIVFLSITIILPLCFSCVPKVRAADVTHSGHITVDTIWSASDTHIITNDILAEGVQIDAGVTLTIEPGAIVKFRDYAAPNQVGITNSGTLIANGTVSQPITFTRETANYWKYIRNDGVMRLTYCNIEYGGCPIGASGYYHEIIAAGSSNLIENCNIGNSSFANLQLINTDNSTVRNNIFENNTGTGVRIQSCNPTLSNNVFQNISIGCVIEGSNNSIISNNSFENMISRAILINNSSPQIFNNTFTNINGGLVIDVINNSMPLIKGNLISNCSAVGIYLEGAQANIENNILDGGNTAQDGMQIGNYSSATIIRNKINNYTQNAIQNAIFTNNAEVVINYNDFTGNTGLAINNVAVSTLNGTKNYYGSSTGPTHASNPGGTGNTISDNVNYNPWLDASFETLPTINSINLAEGQIIGGIYPILVDASWVVHNLPQEDFTKVDFYIDGVFTATDTTYPYTYEWDTTVHASPHVVRVLATNVLGTTNEKIVNVEVVNELPYTGR